jgi:hypothetical protein
LVVCASGCFEGVPKVTSRGDHFTDCITGTQPLTELAKRPVRDARHRRDEQGIRQSKLTDVHVFIKVKKRLGERQYQSCLRVRNWILTAQNFSN